MLRTLVGFRSDRGLKLPAGDLYFFFGLPLFAITDFAWVPSSSYATALSGLGQMDGKYRYRATCYYVGLPDCQVSRSGCGKSPNGCRCTYTVYAVARHILPLISPFGLVQVIDDDESRQKGEVPQKYCIPPFPLALARLLVGLARTITSG